MSPERAALLEELAREILHNYGTGRPLVGVDGADAVRVAGFADDLVAILREQGVEARESGFSTTEFHSTIADFRAGEGDALLVVNGPLLGSPFADAFAWTMWVDSGDPGIGGQGTRTSADAIVDAIDPAHPIRRFSDWCVVPRR